MQAAVDAVNALALFVVVGSALGWCVAASRLWRNQRLIEHQPRRLVPWGLVDLIVIVVLLLISQLLVFGLSESILGVSLEGGLRELPPREQASVMGLFSCSTLMTWAMSVIWLRLRHAVSAIDMGWAGGHAGEDTRVGLAGYVMLVAPVFTLQHALTVWMGLETKHPLVELLIDFPDPVFFVLSTFAAVLIAPLVEEYFFRVYLQGWMENLAIMWSNRWQSGLTAETRRRGAVVGPFLPVTAEILAGDAVDSPPMPVDPLPDASLVATEPGGSVEPLSTLQNAVYEAESLRELRPGPVWWPIVVSSLLFALAHYSHGPDPIPLFFLAMGLGYIYQRTHRVWPCILIHMLVNGFSLLTLWLTVNQPS